jgi:3D (Asp-Asp-Asp) domain-containing protein
VFALLFATAAEARGRWLVFHATAYTVPGTTASGKVTREGRTVAADPAVLPIGSKIEVRGAGPYSGIYVVSDTGPKINGREIDIYIDDNAAAKRFGSKRVRVRVLQRGKPKEVEAKR